MGGAAASGSRDLSTAVAAPSRDTAGRSRPVDGEYEGPSEEGSTSEAADGAAPVHKPSRQDLKAVTDCLLATQQQLKELT